MVVLDLSYIVVLDTALFTILVLASEHLDLGLSTRLVSVSLLHSLAPCAASLRAWRVPATRSKRAAKRPQR
eukprot:scaffold39960_cov61-Phaeocystis_antarctica.AAC.2